jgi:lipopolysaccharide export system protein LptA
VRRWQRRVRLAIGAFAIVFAAFVARQLRPRDEPLRATPVSKSDPGAVVETTGGTLGKFSMSRRDVSVTFQKQLTYSDGTSRLLGVTIVAPEKNGSRTFTITGREGRVGNNDSSIVLDGDVRLAASDGMTAATEHATYVDSEATVRAPGPTAFGRGRMHGTGVGMTWDKAQDVLTILDQASVHFAPDDKGAGAADVASGSATFARREKIVRFDKAARIQRNGQLLEAAQTVVYLTEDEKRIDTVELHDQARITSANAAPGALQSLTGQTMNLKYGEDGETLQHALISGNAQIQVAGEPKKQGRQIAANLLDITLAPDGSTPTALLGRDAVQLTFPPEPGQAARTIQASNLDGKGEPGKGLTRAQFTGSVQYRERLNETARAASAANLDVTLSPGMSSIEQATFSRGVRFEEGAMAAIAAAGKYDVDKGTLALSGSEPGAVAPHVVNDKIVIDAVSMDVTLEGPKVSAVGAVRSELKPPPKPKPGETADVRMPSMLKQDQSVFVVAEYLDYDGTASAAIYSGGARLFQGDTSIKADVIEIDNKAGNLNATGGVTTATILKQTARGGGKDAKETKDTESKTPSLATADDLTYADSERQLIYTGTAHMTGPNGDMTAARIDLFLKPSGDELERAEAFQNLTLREQNRETKGAKMIYTTADETYVITGAPVKIVDQCKRETVGRTLTFNKGTDSIVVDGNSQIRTQTKGGNGKCP